MTKANKTQTRAATFSFDKAVIAGVGNDFRSEATQNAKIKATRETLNATMVLNYARICGQIWDVKLTAKGNLPSGAQQALIRAFHEHGGAEVDTAKNGNLSLKKGGKFKKLLDGSVGISRYRKKLGIDVPTQGDPVKFIHDALVANELTTQGKIHAYISPDANKSKLAVRIEGIVGRMTYAKPEGQPVPSNFRLPAEWTLEEAEAEFARQMAVAYMARDNAEQLDSKATTMAELLAKMDESDES